MNEALASPEAYQVAFTFLLLAVLVIWFRAHGRLPLWGWLLAVLAALLPWMNSHSVPPGTVALVLLPVLAFQAGFSLPPTALRRAGRLWAGAGVTAWALPLLGAFALARFAFGLPTPAALAVGMLAAAGDALALTAIRERLRVPRWLEEALEAQHLLALGLSAVGLALLLEWTPSIALMTALGLLLLKAAFPLALGIAVGLALSVIGRRSGDSVVQWALTVTAAYAAFLTAEALGGTGVVAAAAAGATLARRHVREDLSLVPASMLTTFWESAAMLAGVLAFVLAGIEVIRSGEFVAWPVWAAFVVAMLLRPLAVLPLAPFLRATAPRGWRRGLPLFAWGSALGPVTLALTLALPAEFPQRDLLVSGMLAMCLVSAFLHPRALPLFAENLGLEQYTRYEETRKRLAVALLASGYARDELDRMAMEGLVSPQVRDILKMRLADEEAVLDGELALMGAASVEAESIQVRRARIRMILAQREAVLLAARIRIVDMLTAQELLAQLDEALATMPRLRR